MGDSAGAGLMYSMLIALATGGGSGIHASRPATVVALSPMVDVECLDRLSSDASACGASWADNQESDVYTSEQVVVNILHRYLLGTCTDNASTENDAFPEHPNLTGLRHLLHASSELCAGSDILKTYNASHPLVSPALASDSLWEKALPEQTMLI